MNDKKYTASTNWTQPYTHIWIGSTSRKRQIIDAMMNDLYEQQLAFIDAAVDQSDLSESKALISWIMQKQ